MTVRPGAYRFAIIPGLAAILLGGCHHEPHAKCDVLIVDGTQPHYEGAPCATVYPTEELARAMDPAAGQGNQRTMLNLGVSERTRWIHLPIEFTESAAREGEVFHLEIDMAPIDEVEFFAVRDGQTITRIPTGITQPLERRVVQHEFFQLPMRAQAGRTDVFIRLQSIEALVFHLRVWDREAQAKRDVYRSLFFGVIAGIMLGMSLYNLTLFYSIRDRAYLYYAIYIAAFMIFFTIIYGFAPRVFFFIPDFLMLRIAQLFSLITSTFGLAFSRSFLLVRFHHPRIYKAMSALIGLHLVAIAANYALPSVYAVWVANILPMLAILIIMPTAILIARHFPPARYFVIAWAFLIVSVLVFIFTNIGGLPGNFVTRNGQLFGAALEAVLLSLALGYRIRNLQQAEEEARKQALTEKERALSIQTRMSEAFARFVPREFLKYLERKSVLDIRHGDAIQKEMTVLFTDIRGFTTLSERLGSRATFEFLNEYLAQMEPIIHRHSGFIDKFIGDAIMALFPDPAASVRAAHEMILALERLEQPGRDSVSTGIGLHHGELMLGTVGSPNRLETTVIGDTVNLASRIEGVNRDYGTRIVLSGKVYRFVAEDEPCIREIDTVLVKGKERPVVLFELFSADPDELRESKLRHMDVFLRAMAQFKAGEFQQADESFLGYEGLCPGDSVVKLYRDRLAALKDKPVPSDWRGIYRTWK